MSKHSTSTGGPRLDSLLRKKKKKGTGVSGGGELESDQGLRFDAANSSPFFLPQASLHCIPIANDPQSRPGVCCAQLQALPVLRFGLSSSECSPKNPVPSPQGLCHICLRL